MRVEVLFNQDAKVSAKVMDALRGQLESQLNPLFPKLSLRIAKSSSSMVQITGTKSDADKQQVMTILESVWHDDSWLPE
ncbi:DinI-like family protein [Atlantibacter sp.]|uniref:DinI-like family protein n=1 Tax=Atlantibacter sp. TaxID=1903473 RepID=UPI0028A0ABA3|nr:DinI-like family protein [Atlantibacter sp.]